MRYDAALNGIDLMSNDGAGPAFGTGGDGYGGDMGAVFRR